jgi:hypothetical protein
LSDKIIWICCFALVAVGVVLGSNIATNPEVTAGIASYLDILASVATIVAAFIAIYTLNSWKKQFRHEARFNAFSRLEESTRLCFRHLSKHDSLYFLKSLTAMVESKSNTRYDSEIEDSIRLSVEAHSEYSGNLDFAISLLDPDDELPALLRAESLNVYLQEAIQKRADEYEDSVQNSRGMTAYSSLDRERLTQMMAEIRRLRDK